MSELFNCSLDYLLKESEESDNKNQHNEEILFFRKHLRERKSEKTVWGMPLWHIGRNARGFVAVGLNARGVIAVGLKAKGIVSLGLQKWILRMEKWTFKTKKWILKVYFPKKVVIFR